MNEKSPYAVFTITGAGSQALSLELQPGTTGSAILGTDTSTDLQVFDGTSWVNYSPSSIVNLMDGQLLVRVAINNDSTYEGAETFQLAITPVGGPAVSATGTISDDGTGAIFPDNTTGNPDPDAIKDDDRAVKVNNIEVNENSPWGVFEVTGSAGQALSLALTNGSATNPQDYGTQLQVFNGTSWVPYSSSVRIPTGGKLLVRVAIVDDTTYEGPQTFQLTATTSGGTASTGTATILDDGTGAIFPDNTTGNPDPDAPKDDDRLLSVSNVQVNENSPYAVFEVTWPGSTPPANLQLALLNDSDPLTADARLGVDSGTQLQYFDGTNWVNYTNPINAISTPSLLVRVAINDDTTFEGPETFQLSATPGGGSASLGTATINDDGTGAIFPDNTTGNPDPDAPKDDDRSVKVNDITVNEGSPYAVFCITGAAGQTLTLALQNDNDPLSANASLGSDTGTKLEVLVNGNWVAYSSSAAIPSDGKLLVRVAINNDTTYEGPETFQLTATPTGGSTSYGTATVNDDGTGAYYPNNTTGNPDADAVLNDDRAVKVTDIEVNEASPYAVFRITGAVNQSVSLGLQNDNDPLTADAILGSDTGNAGTSVPLQYYDQIADSWKDYTGGTVSLTNGELLVRTAINNDSTYEGPETFQLAVTPTGGSTSYGTATILDDGSGAIFPDNSTGAPDPDAVKDDDRALHINSIEVNERSPYAVFEVKGTAGQLLNLSLLNDNDPLTANATLGSDTGNQLEYFDGTNWQPYTTVVPIPASGTLLVRTTINNDSGYEGPETFQLAATPVGGTASYGSATILDDGTGAIFPDNKLGNPDPDAIKDDDRIVKVNDIAINEDSPWGVFEVTGTAGQTLTLGLLTDSDPLTANASLGTDTSTQLQVFNGTSWVNYSSSVKVPTGGKLLVRVAINDDKTYEGPETFQLSATPTGGITTYGTATILDDGTGNIFPNNTTGNPDPDAIKDDDRDVTVNNIEVNEASPYAVFRITGAVNQSVFLGLQNDNDPLTADAIFDYTIPDSDTAKTSTTGPEPLQYFNGTNWQDYTGGNVSLTNGELLVRIAINNDSTYEGPETFQLVVTQIGGTVSYGTATILDDGSGAIFPDNNTGTFDPDAAKDDDRALHINSIEVNERSPYAVFEVSGAVNQLVTLALLNDNDPLTANATLGTDSGTQLQYLNGTLWVNYTSSVRIPAGGTLLVRTAINNDSTYEGPEDFLLAATPAGGTTVYGTATILDDGTGKVYSSNITGNPDLNPILDDDRAVKVNNIEVNEASPYAVFCITGTAGQTLTLNLQTDNDPLTDDADPYDGSPTGSLTLEVLINGTWGAYNNSVKIPTDGKLLVRTTIYNDPTFEGPETFQLRATPTGGITSYGTATILDDGTGDLFSGNNTTGLPEAPGSNGLPANLDDDRSISVNNIEVNENSPFAVFKITWTGTQPVLGLTLQNDNNPLTANARLGTDTGLTLEWYDGNNWFAYAGPSFTPTTSNPNEVLVRVAINDDVLYEGPETFQLAVTKDPTTTPSTTYGTATILDNGFGDIFDPKSGQVDPTAPKDNDSLRLASHTDSGTVGDLSTANGLPQLQLIAPSGGATLSLKGANGTLLAANQYNVREVALNDQSGLSVYVIDLVDADTSKTGVQNFGTYYQGLETGNNVNTRDGFYTVLLNNDPVGTFEIKTNPLTKATRISCLNAIFSKNRNLALESTLYGHRTVKTAGTSGDDILTGLNSANDTLNGGNGNDILNGAYNRLNKPPYNLQATDPTNQARLGDSTTQIDTLTGGRGSDIFQLGDVAGAYYNTINSSNNPTGGGDYAKITDFETVDTLLLHGRAEDYTLGSVVGGIRNLYYNANGSGDLIAEIRGSGIASLSLTDPSKVTFL